MKRMTRETSHWRGRTSQYTEGLSLVVITWLLTDQIVFSLHEWDAEK